jgi:hypothetical protein
MVFPTCESISPSTGIGSNCKINIAYNQQKPLCTSTSPTVSQKNCRMPDQLCSADPGFKFDFTPGSPVRAVHRSSPSVLRLTDLYSGSPASISRRYGRTERTHSYSSTRRFRLRCPFRFVSEILILMVSQILCLSWCIRTARGRPMSWFLTHAPQVLRGARRPSVGLSVF